MSENVKLKPKAKRKRRKPMLNPSLMREALKLDVETNRHWLYECAIQTGMTEAAFKLENTRSKKRSGYVV
jgi:hypothetical protein